MLSFLLGPTLVYILFTFCASVIGLVSASLVNITVDDTYGDPTTGAHFVYTPPQAWAAGPMCSSCPAQLDANDTYMNTWHSGMFFPSSAGLGSGVPSTASVSFNGSAVYVFCVIAIQAQDFDANMELTFMLDDEVVGVFDLFPPDGADAFSYDVPVYSNASVPAGMHNLTLVNGQSGGIQSLVLLDYIIYSTDAPPSSLTASLPVVTASSTTTVWEQPSTTATSSSSSRPTTHNRMIAITVSIVCGTVFLALLSVLLVSLHRRQFHIRVPWSLNRRPDMTKRGPSPHVDGDEDPGVSGWAEGTWDGHKSVGTDTELPPKRWWSIFSESPSSRGSVDEPPRARSKTVGGSFILPELKADILGATNQSTISSSSSVVVIRPPPPGLHVEQPVRAPESMAVDMHHVARARPESIKIAEPTIASQRVSSPRRMPTSDSLFVEVEFMESSDSSSVSESTPILTPDTPRPAHHPFGAAAIKAGRQIISSSWGTGLEALRWDPQAVAVRDATLTPNKDPTEREAEVVQSPERMAEEQVKMAARQEARFFTVGSGGHAVWQADTSAS